VGRRWWHYCGVSPSTFIASGPPAPWRALAVFTLLAVLLHGLVLNALPWGLGEGLSGGVRTIKARQIVLAAPAPAADVAAAAPAPLKRPKRPPASTAPEPTAVPDAAPAVPPVAPLPAPVEVAAAAVPEVAAPAAPAASEPTAEAPAVTAAAATPAAATVDGGGKNIPTFATRLPPSVTLAYELRRGGLSGEGEMVWRPRADGYALTLQGTAFGIPIIAWASQGAFDANGIAPERFMDRRRSRDVRAANFQREAGKISFSSPTTEYPLVPGAQDRLSWMVQLPGIVQAAPESFGPGARIPIFVVGARGDADVWTFIVETSEAVELPSGRVENTLRLLREPRKPFDTRVEVWLDPARHHLPVRLRLSTPQSGDSNEFVLKQMTELPP
jgi:Protein of unknown function (DUF3108)